MSADLDCLKDSEVNPIKVGRTLDAATSRAWRDWLPEHVEDFVGTLSVQQLDKVLAVQAGCTNKDCFDHWPLFNAVVIAFNHRRVNFQHLDVPTVAELAWGCECLRELHPNANWGSEVLRYIGAAMAYEGYVFFPWTGGRGLALSEAEGAWANGLMSVDPELLKSLRAAWDKLDGDIDLTRVDEADPLQAQLAKLLRVREYIKAQGSAS